MAAILCPSCHKLINVDEARCPFCGQTKPGLWGFTSLARRLGVQLDFSRLIIGVCAVLYVLMLLIDPGAIFQMRGIFNILAPSGEAGYLFGSTGLIPVIRDGRWWTLFTAVYLHGSLLHIFFNMMWVRQLGPLVEELFGPMRLFVIFTVAGVLGFLFSVGSGLLALTGGDSMLVRLIVQVFGGAGFTLGASGGVFGLMGAAIAYGRRTGSTLFTRQFVQWALMLFVFGLFFSGVDNAAHLGGFIGGYGTAYLFAQSGGREGLWTWVGTAACLVLTVFAFGRQLLAVVLGV
ncbi:MAG: rhomboid family intramembrane serine protease [Candidatus Latescibacteria bacterium]|nr:rhomboid family intramembrane serine protease [Candidatus Latescibacterota bacterium]